MKPFLLFVLLLSFTGAANALNCPTGETHYEKWIKLDRTDEKDENKFSYTDVPVGSASQGRIVVQARGDLGSSAQEEYWVITGETGSQLTTVGGSPDCAGESSGSADLDGSLLTSWASDSSVVFYATDAGGISGGCSSSYVRIKLELCVAPGVLTIPEPESEPQPEPVTVPAASVAALALLSLLLVAGSGVALHNKDSDRR